jgi:hypothetical protein
MNFALGGRRSTAGYAKRRTQEKTMMGVIKRREMLVTFRVSAEEHRSLQASCSKSGARSISEFVRVAALEKAQMMEGPDGGLSGALLTLGRSLRELDTVLGDARKRIRAVLGPVPRGQEHGTDAAGSEHESL